ncbi:sulfatase-like hydrolase/transferase [Oleiharenicola lentus]|uniref:sulfatase-like hydrolase/transferase n=1 Tax=Oleiharenicola lentus TaxID=2508720 RepID=UPI003F66AB29
MRKFITLFGLFCGFAIFAHAAEAKRPNVLFIAVDDLRTNLGCYGDAAAITPAIDALAARGTRFDAAYCQQAVCNPSRTSLMTGRRPDSTRVWDLVTKFRETTPDVVTLPQYFKQHGYFTAMVGKIYHDGGKMGDPASWSQPAQHDGIPKEADYRLPKNQKGGKAAAYEFADAPENVYPDGRVADAAIAEITKLAARANDQPFFYAVGFRKPHLPFTAPKKYWDLYEGKKIPALEQPTAPRGAPEIALHHSVELRGYSDLPANGDFAPATIENLRRAYYAATSFTDAQIGRVLAALKTAGVADSTIVVLYSDHGFHLGEHGLWAKTTNYEVDTRVPLIIAPLGKSKGAATSALTELLDLYPTLADLCGLPAPEKTEGRTLRPWLENPATPSREAVFSQFPRPWPSRNAPKTMGYAVRTAQQRYVEWRDFQSGEVAARELYDYANPGAFEAVNLADDPSRAADVTALAALLPPRKVAANSNKAWRADALNRPRRVIFNNDGNDPILKIKRPSVEDMLAARTTPLVGTHVDSIFYCSFSAGFGNFSHLTKVGQVHFAQEDIFVNNQLPALATAGIDPLTEMVKFAHGHGIELFWSMRMNDTHDAGKSGQGPVLFKLNKLKQAHPEFLLGEPFEKLKAGSWSGVDYAHPEIRELAFRYVEEVCANYEVDGVELDFFRHPVFFKGPARGIAATDAERAMMTDLLRRIRAMAETKGRARGRPILIAVRVPDSAAYSRVMGLDVERWLAEDLADILVVGGYFQLNEWNESVALGHRYGVKVYPSLDDSRVKGEGSAEKRMSDEGYRGRAAVAWAAGADGVYLFNQFNPKRKLWNELGDPRGLAKLDRDYFASIYGVARAAGGNFPHQKFQTLETLNPGDPKELPAAKAVMAKLMLDASPSQAKSRTLGLQFDQPFASHQLSVKLNDTTLAANREANGWIFFPVNAAMLKAGANTVSVTRAEKSSEFKWLDLVLEVRP